VSNTFVLTPSNIMVFTLPLRTREREMQREARKMTAQQTLAFFASVIKSGEAWSDTCTEAYGDAQLDVVATKEAARAMLAALEKVAALIRKHGIGDSDAESEPVVAGMYAAIAAAKAAGIGEEA
jgi:hypothetical protein